MRELTMSELERVSGGTGQCTPQSDGNTYGGISNPKTIGEELVDIYEGLIEATSYMIERVATSF